MTPTLALIFVVLGLFWLLKHPGAISRAIMFVAFVGTALVITVTSQRRGLGVPWGRLAGLAAQFKLSSIQRQLRTRNREAGVAEYRWYKATGGARARWPMDSEGQPLSPRQAGDL